MFALTDALARGYRLQRASMAQSHFDKGRDLAREGRNDQAIDEYRRALAFNPADRGYRLSLAEALFETGHMNEAIAHLAELHEEDPTDGDVSLWLARIHARQGNSAEAIIWYHRAIYGYWRDDPARHRIDARWELINYLAQHGDRQRLIAELLELYGEAPDDARLRLKIGRMLLDHGAVENAKEVFQETANSNPRFIDAWSALADAEMANREYAAAREALRRAWRLNPRDSTIWRRIETVNDILALDPQLSTLSANERFHRSHELLSRALSSVQDCAQSANKTLSDADQAEIASAATLLKAKRNAAREGLTPKMIAAAMSVWRVRGQVCGSTSADPALSAVLSTMEKQQ